MRVSSYSNMDVVRTATSENTNIEIGKANQTSNATNFELKEPLKQNVSIDNSEETKVKVKEAVEKMNEMLKVNHNTSKFQYHEGLDRYYVTVVDQKTEEVVKEIPPKKLLDAFYEMQKMLGMVVDEKI